MKKKIEIEKLTSGYKITVVSSDKYSKCDNCGKLNTDEHGKSDIFSVLSFTYHEFTSDRLTPEQIIIAGLKQIVGKGKNGN